MRAPPAFDLNHTSRRVVSALAGLAVAVAMARLGFARRLDASRYDAGVRRAATT